MPNGYMHTRTRISMPIYSSRAQCDWPKARYQAAEVLA